MTEAAKTPAAETKAPVDEDEDLTPYPTQEQLDAIKRGEQLEAGKSGAYRTRQMKAD